MTNSIESREGFEKLPEDAKQAIRKFNYDQVLKEIHTVYKLHIDQAATLESIIAEVVFGTFEGGSMLEKVEKELRLDPTRAGELVMDVNRKILRPIQENMRMIQEGGTI